nr:ribbon-helix-helix domain-containing protein [uncultured Azospirillum sp.]
MGYAWIGPDGKLTLPQSVRDRLRLGPGGSLRVEVTADDHGLALSPASPPLEPFLWEALADIAKREGRSVEDLCDLVRERIAAIARRGDRAPDDAPQTLASALRIYITGYYRRACEGGEPVSADPFAGTPLALPDVAATATSTRPEHRIEDLFGIAGRSRRPVSVEEMDEAIQDAAAERFRRT